MNEEEENTQQPSKVEGEKGAAASYFKDSEEVRQSLLRRFRWTEKKIQLYSDDEKYEKRVESLTNTQQRLAKSIIDVVSLMKNPRLNVSGEEEKDEDLARIVELVHSHKKALTK